MHGICFPKRYSFSRQDPINFPHILFAAFARRTHARYTINESHCADTYACGYLCNLCYLCTCKLVRVLTGPRPRRIQFLNPFIEHADSVGSARDRTMEHTYTHNTCRPPSRRAPHNSRYMHTHTLSPHIWVAAASKRLFHTLFIIASSVQTSYIYTH